MITKVLVKLLATMGLPDIVHHDQEQTFISAILWQTLDAFAIMKSHITACHPQGNGLVEKFICSLF